MTAPSKPPRQLKIGFNLVGGPHQWRHILPLAADLSRRADVRVILFAPDATAFRPAYDLFKRLGGAPAVQWITLILPELLEQGADRPLHGASLQSVRLLRWSRCMKACDVLVSGEQTGFVGEVVGAPPGWADRASWKPTEASAPQR